LTITRQVLRKGYKDYNHVHYIIIARDYFPWFSDEQVVVEHGVFKRALTSSSDLNEMVVRLKAYEWLPVEGRDFSVIFETNSCGNSSIELEGFHPMPAVRP
jgi:hypothetical protein